jgi:hypothetical protein
VAAQLLRVPRRLPVLVALRLPEGQLAALQPERSAEEPQRGGRREPEALRPPAEQPAQQAVRPAVRQVRAPLRQGGQRRAVVLQRELPQVAEPLALVPERVPQRRLAQPVATPTS